MRPLTQHIPTLNSQENNCAMTKSSSISCGNLQKNANIPFRFCQYSFTLLHNVHSQRIRRSYKFNNVCANDCTYNPYHSNLLIRISLTRRHMWMFEIHFRAAHGFYKRVAWTDVWVHSRFYLIRWTHSIHSSSLLWCQFSRHIYTQRPRRYAVWQHYARWQLEECWPRSHLSWPVCYRWLCSNSIILQYIWWVRPNPVEFKPRRDEVMIMVSNHESENFAHIRFVSDPRHEDDGWELLVQGASTRCTARIFTSRFKSHIQ